MILVRFWLLSFFLTLLIGTFAVMIVSIYSPSPPLPFKSSFILAKETVIKEGYYYYYYNFFSSQNSLRIWQSLFFPNQTDDRLLGKKAAEYVGGYFYTLSSFCRLLHCHCKLSVFFFCFHIFPFIFCFSK